MSDGPTMQTMYATVPYKDNEQQDIQPGRNMLCLRTTSSFSVPLSADIIITEATIGRVCHVMLKFSATVQRLF